MSELILDECLTHLYLANESAKYYKKITSYDLIVESEAAVNKQQEVNTKAAASTKGHVGGAIDSLLNLIKTIIESISSGIQSMFSDKKLDEAEKAFKANPKKFAGHKISTVDMKNIDNEYAKLNASYDKYMDYVEKSPDEAKAQVFQFKRDVMNFTKSVKATSDIVKSLRDNNVSLAGVGKDMIVAYDVEAALRVAANDRNEAKKVYNSFVRNQARMEQLQNHYGRKGAEEVMKELESMTNVVSVSRLMAQATHSYSKTKEKAYWDIANDIRSVCTGTNFSGTTASNNTKNRGKISAARIGYNTTKAKEGHNMVNSILAAGTKKNTSI